MAMLPEKPRRWRELGWAGARLLFFAYSAVCIVSIVGGYLTAPLFTWVFYGDWRFWRHLGSARHLWSHGCRMLFLILQRRNGGFALSVELTAPPALAANPALVQLSPCWEFGPTCGPCTRCCSKHRCPILNDRTGLCRGYGSFYWRYFNCGRFPTRQDEIDYYICPKWVIRHDVEPAWTTMAGAATRVA